MVLETLFQFFLYLDFPPLPGSSLLSAPQDHRNLLATCVPAAADRCLLWETSVHAPGGCSSGDHTTWTEPRALKGP